MDCKSPALTVLERARERPRDNSLNSGTYIHPYTLYLHTHIRQLLESERQSFTREIEGLQRAHCEEVERVRGEEGGRWREELNRQKEEWERVCEQRDMQHRGEVKLVREEGEREMRERLDREQEKHHSQMSKRRATK